MAAERLRTVLDEIAKDNDYVNHDLRIEEVSTGGANYTSKLYHATISASQRNDIQLFAKVCAVNESMRGTIPNIFILEFIFYRELKIIYENLEEKNGVPKEQRLTVPKYYKCNPNDFEEVLVLENLAVNGFMDYNRMKSITWEYAAAAVEQLAKFHALSLAYQYEDPEQFAKTTEKLTFMMDGTGQMKDIFTSTLPLILQIIKEENKERIKNIFENIDGYDYWIQCFQAKRQKVIIHCDYRTSNLMHRRRNGKLEVVPVDFQTLYGGCPVTDLMYFIYTGSDAEFRKYHYTNLIEFYYAKLSAALRSLKVDIADVYPKENFEGDLEDEGYSPAIIKQRLGGMYGKSSPSYSTMKNWVKELRFRCDTVEDAGHEGRPVEVVTPETILIIEVKFFGLITAVTILSVVCVNTEDAPNLDEITELNDFIVKPSDVYKSRLNGIVDDYIRWGLL